MLDAYEGLLARMEVRARAEGWPLATRATLSKREKLRLGLRALARR